MLVVTIIRYTTMWFQFQASYIPNTSNFSSIEGALKLRTNSPYSVMSRFSRNPPLKSRNRNQVINHMSMEYYQNWRSKIQNFQKALEKDHDTTCCADHSNRNHFIFQEKAHTFRLKRERNEQRPYCIYNINRNHSTRHRTTITPLPPY